MLFICCCVRSLICCFAFRAADCGCVVCLSMCVLFLCNGCCVCDDFGGDAMGLSCHGASKASCCFIGCQVSISLMILFIHASASFGSVVVCDAFRTQRLWQLPLTQ